MLELLAPAKNADIGIEAIRHGADAVYIGAPAFGARKAAANSIRDIHRLCQFAHIFSAKVYATINTIIYDDEIEEVKKIINSLYEIGVDALIVQDLALKNIDIPPIPLHASTQMDNRTPEKVKALQALGFRQVVLARELSIDQIAEIHDQCPDVRLEAFVHGALCVSLSGRCYASHAITGRSANRGECAQICRLKFDLQNAKGDELVTGKHLLSLKDLCRIEYLEEMALAGVSSFKIEGRLKDMNYVKNVTAAYATQLDKLVEKHPEKFKRASHGKVDIFFKPDVEKSFNRGFTDYFLLGTNNGVLSPNTPKAIGKRVGKINDVFTDSIIVDTQANDIEFANGDGLCTFMSDGTLVGFRVNRVVGNRLYTGRTVYGLRRGMVVFRNFDKKFDDLLNGSTAERKLPLDIEISFSHQNSVFNIKVNGEFSKEFEFETQPARTPQQENLYRQFAKMGNTPFYLKTLNVKYSENLFIPSSVIAEWRRNITQAYTEFLQDKNKPNSVEKTKPNTETDKFNPILNELEPINVANQIAKSMYKDFNPQIPVRPAFEISPDNQDHDIMTCRHCIRFALGWCPVKQQPRQGAPSQSEDLFLVLKNGGRLSLHFDCKNCLMTIKDAPQ